MKHFKHILSVLLLSLFTSGNFAVKAESWISDTTNPYPASVRKSNSLKALAPDSDDEYLMFGYCKDYYRGLGTGKANITVEGAICIPEEIAKKYEGSQLTRIFIGYGKTSYTNVTVYLTESLTGNAFYTQDATMTTTEGWNEVVLDTPYTIEGKTFYVGYQTKQYAATDYPIGVDGEATTNPNASFLGVNNTFENYGESFGAICIKVGIEGDNLPQYSANILSANVPSYVGIEAPFTASLSISNDGVKAINDIEVSCKVGDSEAKNTTISFNSPIKSSYTTELVIDEITCNKLGTDIPLTITIEKINGQKYDNPDNNTYSTKINCVEKVFKQNATVEEFTGTWCGWCVRGIVGMEYMEKKYGEDGFIGIAVHNGDPMAVNAYQSVLNAFAAEGLPNATINRSETFDPSIETLEYYYKLYTQNPALAEVRLTKATSKSEEEDSKTISIFNVEAEAEFSLDQTDAKYALSFVVIEDNVGPYTQQNYYSGGAYGPMDGWENEGKNVKIMYNDVARLIETAYGIGGSIPSNIEKNKPYSYSATLTARNIADINNCEVIALLFNTSTKKIVNATKVKPVYTGIKDPVMEGEEALNIYGMPGAIVINGEYNQCAVYGIDGSMVNSSNGDNVINMDAGVYVVKATKSNGSIVTRKVYVK